jgi:hypothetical protein
MGAIRLRRLHVIEDAAVGRIYSEMIHREPKWLWFLRHAPVPVWVATPNRGTADSLAWVRRRQRSPSVMARSRGRDDVAPITLSAKKPAVRPVWLLLGLAVGLLAAVTRKAYLLAPVPTPSGLAHARYEHRKTYPADDLISMLMNANGKSGQLLSDAHVPALLQLLLIAASTPPGARSAPRCGISSGPRRSASA